MSASCHVANTPQMTCRPDTYWHAGKMPGMLAQHWEENVVPTFQTTCQQDIIQDFADMLADSFGHNEKKQSFVKNFAVMV